MKVKLIVQTIIYLWKNLGVHGNYQKLQIINNEGLFFSVVKSSKMVKTSSSQCL